MPTEIDELKALLARFRQELVTALAGIDIEINALQQAVKEQGLNPERLKQIRSQSCQLLERFEKSHSQHLPLIE